jgi:excisionase family DNA binding protein
MSVSPLFVRLPRAQADALDRASFELKTSKQDLVAGLITRYVDLSAPETLAELLALAQEGREEKREPFGFGAAATRRVTIETEPDRVAVGRAGFRSAEGPDVLTVEQAAELLVVAPDAVRALAESGDLPARQIGDEWRFARTAILAWLAGGGG